MARQVIDAEADTLEEAKKLALNQMPDGFHQISEKVISDGKQEIARVSAETADRALEDAKKRIPSNATILREEITSPPQHEILLIEAKDESLAKAQISKSLIIKSLSIVLEGRRGFLGLGAKPNRYEVGVVNPAKVEVVFKRKARVQLKISDGKVPSKGYCQMCGKPNSPAEESEKTVHFFCSPSCATRYYQLSISSRLFGDETFVINATGGDISQLLDEGRASVASARITCWSCGHKLPIGSRECSACGESQELIP